MVDSERWHDLLEPIIREAEISRCRLLTSTPMSDEVAEVAETLQLLRRTLPPATAFVLRQWPERGAALLLEELPRQLNPGATATDLDPTGHPMRDRFPEFAQLLDRTQEFAVLVDVEERGQVLLAGLLDQRDDEVPTDWAYA